MIRLGYIAPILLIALPLAACDKDNPFEKALTVLNGGTPVAGGSSMRLSSAPPVVEQEVEVPAPCQIVGAEFRTHWCNPDTGRKELIP